MQGSALGPLLFSLLISDLKAISNENLLVKFADDVSVCSPESSSTPLHLEVEHIRVWATSNGLLLNSLKTKEIVFSLPRFEKLAPPPLLHGIERVLSAKLLGINLSARLPSSSTLHCDAVVGSCVRQMFLLRYFKVRGLNRAALCILYHALILSRVTYAISAWGGFVSSHDKSRIDSLLRRCCKFGYASNCDSFDALLASSAA